MLQSGRATLRELRECYSLEDMMNIWEAYYTGEANKAIARERAIAEANRRRK